MDTELITRLNILWEPIYPYLGRWMESWAPKDAGRILETGPFSGGIISALLKCLPSRQGIIALSETAVARTIRKSFDPLCPVLISHLNRLPLLPVFDLVICRGAFFFLTPEIIKEILRVLRPEGMRCWEGDTVRIPPGDYLTHCRRIQRPQLPPGKDMDFPRGTSENGCPNEF